ncbi:F-actin-monooxygenase MICAL2 isoform X2 [Oryzias latipes]|uniref:F-actin-monooxygenase MICAL2 isoform X2 n=1 Tax=Oryzias latipes TaxID=8090 RepID=UPI000CE2711D|nr:F-actin-monooxygenase MICAL2 isoform X2 [Oryzias latipes]
MGEKSHPECQAQELFDEFVSASTCRAVLRCFTQLCEHLQLDPSAPQRPLYQPLKQRLNYWRANALWAKLDRRAAQPEYLRARACSNMTCVVIGAGPCGLRTAVELCFMGARVVVLEKRNSFSRNNVLHLWPFTIHDLRGLGAKKFYGKFSAGSIDHISIRQLQLVLLKVALMLGAEVHVNVEFKQLLDPPEEQLGQKRGWRLEVNPKNHPVSQLEFDVIIGADGRRNTLPGFRRKEFRGKLAIAITANFKNRNTSAEAKVEEISGVAFIFNQRFFQELQQNTGIDLENIVYYKDDTHYFVMTAKKQSLLDKGVILQDFADTEQLLSRENVDHDALQAYAREAASFSTNHQLPDLDFAINHYGQPDVAMFDFTCMYASENAAMIRQRHGHQLLVTLVGDSLLEPFWPMGTGVARGFLAALDSAWMIQRWAQGGAPLEVLAERESLYRLLPQTTPENMQRNISMFTVDPASRYLNTTPLITPAQVRHLMDTGEEAEPITNPSDITGLPPPTVLQKESFSPSNQLLTWFQEQTRGYRGVSVRDLTSSWKDGLALCALLHRYRPDLVDFQSLVRSRGEENLRLAFHVAEEEFGIPPLLTVEEMASVEEPDSLSMIMYLSQFHQLLKHSPPPAGSFGQSADLRAALVVPASLLSRLGTQTSRKRNPKGHRDHQDKRRRRSQLGEEQQQPGAPMIPDGKAEMENLQLCCDGTEGSRVRLMANQLQAKLDEGVAICRTPAAPAKGAPPSAPESAGCPPDAEQKSSWKPRKRTLQQEQMSFRFRERIRGQSASSRSQQVQVGLDEANSLAEQIPDSEQSCGGCSLTCCFCQQRLYVIERLTAEGLFFHRSCFTCDSCGSALRPPSYTFDQHRGKFFCLHHPDCQLSSAAVRKRRPSSDSHRTSMTSQSSGPLLSDSVLSSGRRRSSAASVTAATPERIQLDNHRCSSGADIQEEPEEVSEEVLNHFNLGLDLDDGVQFRDSGMMEGGGDRGPTPEKLWREEPIWPHSEEEEGIGGAEWSEEEELCLQEPVDSDSAHNLQKWCTSSGMFCQTPPTLDTPSTAPFFTSPDCDAEQDIMGVQLSLSSGGWGSSDYIAATPPNTEFISQQTREVGPKEAEPDSDRKASFDKVRLMEASSLPPSLCPPPLQIKGRNLCINMQEEREAPPPGRVDVGGPKALWKMVFSGNCKDQQRNRTEAGEQSCLDSMVLLQRCSLKPRNNLQLDLLDLMNEIQRVSVVDEENPKVSQRNYVPHALAFRRSYLLQKPRVEDRVRYFDGRSSCSTEIVGVVVPAKEPSSLSVKETLFQNQHQEENLDVRTTQRVQITARRQAKKNQLRRLHRAQMIQQQLQQVEEKQRQLEERGVLVEKILRGESGFHQLEETVLMQQWFQLVRQKNSLSRYESELLIFARELALEDRQSWLQQELRESMAVDDRLKGEEQLAVERRLLEEMLELVEERDALVSLLEEQRLQEHQKDLDLEQLMMTGGLGPHWT